MNTIITVAGLVIGALILGAGIYYLSKSKGDKESQKIYGIASLIGTVIVVGLVIKVFVAGW